MPGASPFPPEIFRFIKGLKNDFYSTIAVTYVFVDDVVSAMTFQEDNEDITVISTKKKDLRTSITKADHFYICTINSRFHPNEVSECAIEVLAGNNNDTIVSFEACTDIGIFDGLRSGSPASSEDPDVQKEFHIYSAHDKKPADFKEGEEYINPAMVLVWAFIRQYIKASPYAKKTIHDKPIIFGVPVIGSGSAKGVPLSACFSMFDFRQIASSYEAKLAMKRYKNMLDAFQMSATYVDDLSIIDRVNACSGVMGVSTKEVLKICEISEEHYAKILSKEAVNVISSR